jgi:hypothetical protein
MTCLLIADSVATCNQSEEIIIRNRYLLSLLHPLYSAADVLHQQIQRWNVIIISMHDNCIDGNDENPRTDGGEEALSATCKDTYSTSNYTEQSNKQTIKGTEKNARQ